MTLTRILTLLGIAGFLTLSAQASINYTYLKPGYADGSGKITVTYPTNYSGGVKSESGIYVGQLNMKDPVTNQTFTTFCMSPDGGLSPGTYAFNPITLEDAKYGSNPATWSMTGGIENAAYLFSLHTGTIANSAEGAALNLALWAALYNSTAVGSMTTSGRFSISGAGLSPAIQAAYAADIAQLNAAGQSTVQSLYNQNPAYILRPVNTSLQDLIVLPSSIPAEFLAANAAAPEPSTFVGAALLGLLAVGRMVPNKLKLKRSIQAA